MGLRRTRSRGTALLACAALAGCGGSSGASPAVRSTVSRATLSRTTTPTPAPVARPHHHPERHHRRPAVDPGTLPQTHQLPSAETAAFKREMRALWRGVRLNSLTDARPAFFPEAAYVQVKAIGDATVDFEDRLLSDFRLDIAAAHALLGARARLESVRVPAGFAHWVPPDACYNRVGYWEMPDARVVYRDASGVRSFGIASMISWRGVWYVVHLGAVVRPGASGIVDDPSAGPGTSVPSLTC